MMDFFAVSISPLEGEKEISWNWRKPSLGNSKRGGKTFLTTCVSNSYALFPPLMISKDLAKLSPRNHFLPLKGGEGFLS